MSRTGSVMSFGSHVFVVLNDLLILYTAYYSHKKIVGLVHQSLNLS